MTGEMGSDSVLESFELHGQSAVVTGCRRGIGYAIAEALAEAGADIVGVSANMEPKDSAIQNAVESVGRSYYPMQCDFSNRDQLRELINSIKKQTGSPDILVNNAGTIRRNPATEHADEIWDEVIEVNLNAQFILAREFGKEMVARGSGSIIFVASLLTFQGGITVPGYAASKGAIGQLTKALANEWASQGVRVNALAPGYIATDNTAALREDPVRSQQILDRIPAGRWGEPEDFKGPAVFLASDAARYVHGTILLVDGGWMGR